MQMHVQGDLTHVYRDVLRSLSEIWTSLHQHIDVDVLLAQIADATCEALGYRYNALYLLDALHNSFYVRATSSSLPPEYDTYLRQHPMPATVADLLMQPGFQHCNSYLIPGRSEVWRDVGVAAHFVVVQEGEPVRTISHTTEQLEEPREEGRWYSDDLLLVPLRKADGTIIGFLTPDAPLNELRPTTETMEVLEVFANQATSVIEWAQLYEEARQSSQERAALIKIGRALSSPEALRDLSTVYQVLYEQLCLVMPVDAFYVQRMDLLRDEFTMDFFIDEGVLYPPTGRVFSSIMPWIREMLNNHLTHSFSTSEEYGEFVREHTPRREVLLIGGKRLSESLLFAPIYYGTRVIGMLSVQSYQRHSYTSRHLEMVKEIALQSGIAIMNARRYSELNDAMRQAQDSENLKNQFLMTASHELRTPLTAIQGYLELLSTHSATLDESRKQRFIANARRACDELILLLGNVMDTSRIDQEWVSLKRDAVSITSAVRQILEILDPIISRERREITLALEDDLTVWADDLRLRQVLMNLVSNALKYTPPATRVAIGMAHISREEIVKRVASAQSGAQVDLPDGRYVLIWVRDWGAGISKREQSKLFTKFSRLAGKATQSQRGSGWGLYLSRKLVEAMNGSIWLESSGLVGEGCNFLIALPEVERKSPAS
ncbi:sensor histidine kinase [Ktedonospora formicarum]|uniref:histidine kinase n=1 Tax=Ktedonospora formicarum TaxID=2778364 RepID=A0A8J3IBA7_9CHLR|nr:HAMP domain-containing sensor histidine kinase [Ktedonospora formicarum]GHO50130.1 hypothetical protein KSX_82930 [Ktedonospora formicarum]